jgi:hypothetical protein
VSTDPNAVMAVFGGLAVVVLLISFVLRQVRRSRVAAHAATAQRSFAAPVAAAPLAMNLAAAERHETADRTANGRATAVAGYPKPAFPPSPAQGGGARKVITVVHDFGHPRDYPADGRRYLTTREAFEILAEIRAIPPDKPIDFVLHTPGGEAFACELIASAIKDRPGTTAYVPYCAMSAGTIIALACEKIVLGKYACLGPIDTQFYGFPVESYIRLLKEKPLASIDDEIVLLGYLAEKELKTARSRACELLNKSHFGKDDACRLTDFLVAGDMPHSEQIGRDRALEIGVNIVGGDCPAPVYDLVEQRLRLFQPMGGNDGFGPEYQVRASMLGNIHPPAGALRQQTVFHTMAEDAREARDSAVFSPLSEPMSKLAQDEIIRRLVNAACGFIVKKAAQHAPSKAEVKAMESEIRAFLKDSFAKFGAIIDKYWTQIFEKIVAVFPD